jgi:hypothetical protein
VVKKIKKANRQSRKDMSFGKKITNKDATIKSWKRFRWKKLEKEEIKLAGGKNQNKITNRKS